jgi:cell wall-associated NlpC family hydrolase
MFKNKIIKKPAHFLKKTAILLLFIGTAGFQSSYAQGRTLTQTVSQNTGSGDVLVQKYARMLQVSEAEILRFRTLYAFIDKWMGTPYLWGGCSKKGIDCSCFVMTLFDDVYNINIQRTSFTQFYDKDVSLFKSRKQYSTGDLIFFKTNINRETRNNRVTHVGFYLANGYFVQSSSKGVNIANLNTGFWKSSTVAAGRLKESFYKEAGMTVPGGEVQLNNQQFQAEEDSYFEPPLMNERYDAIIKKYADLLSVAEEELKIPEVLEYIENNNKQIFSVKNCKPGSNPSTCMVGDLYKQVFGVDVETTLYPLQSATTVYTLKKGVDSLAIGDIIFLKTSPRLNYYNKAGVYLHNNQFAHIENGWLVINRLTDPGIQQMRKFYGRFKNDVYDAAGKNLMEKRQYEDSIARERTLPTKIVQEKTAAESNVNTTNNNTSGTVATEQPVAKPVEQIGKPFADFVQRVVVPYDFANEKKYPDYVNTNAKMLNVHQGFIKDSLLYAFAEKWNRAFYRKRGCNIDNGINEKCFVEKYYNEVLKRNISFKTLEEVYHYHAIPLEKEDTFTEGDLLFFGEKNTEGITEVSFVGIYLNGKYFLALSPKSKVVEIISVDDKYYSERFLNAAAPGL